MLPRRASSPLHVAADRFSSSINYIFISKDCNLLRLWAWDSQTVICPVTDGFDSTIPRIFRGHRKCIDSVWYGNVSNQDCKALQRVVRLAECISGSALPSLQDIYFKRCKSRAAKIIKDSNHSDNHFFISLPSGKRFRSMMAKTERLRRSFSPQAIRLLNSNSV